MNAAQIAAFRNVPDHYGAALGRRFCYAVPTVVVRVADFAAVFFSIA
jgi:hypothetical protein